MSEKIKNDPLLNDDPGQNETEEVVAKPVKAESKAKSAPKVQATLKEEAVAKFPEDIKAQTKYILENSEQINFIVPLADGEAPGTVEEPQINGYKMIVPKGTMVKIPIQVANLLAEKYRIGMTAGANKRVDRASDIQDALG